MEYPQRVDAMSGTPGRTRSLQRDDFFILVVISLYLFV
jgi:hypothetical protein